jgi:hypothetical protein
MYGCVCMVVYVWLCMYGCVCMVPPGKVGGTWHQVLALGGGMVGVSCHLVSAGSCHLVSAGSCHLVSPYPLA